MIDIKFIFPVIILSIIFFIISYFSGIIVNKYVIPSVNEKESIFIPVRTIHRIENFYKKPVKIMEAQIGSVLKESDIVRYKDIYGRIN